MPARNLFAFDAAGRVLVVFDGREILVHGGADEAPIWRREVASPIVGLAAAGDAVASLEENGSLRFWAISTGDPLGEVSLGEGVFALTAARKKGIFAILRPDGLLVLERGQEPRRLAFPAPSAAAFSDDGATLAIGGESGELKIVTAAFDPVGSSKLEGEVTSLCWFSTGFWIATSGERVIKVPPSGGDPENITRAGGMAPSCVAAAGDGSMFAVRLSEDLMMALAYPSRDTVVQLQYFDRKVTGVAFGAGRRLGVGLEGGDGNVVDIMAEQLCRTDTFPGRQHNRWMVSTVIKPAVLPAPPRPMAPAGAPPMVFPSAGPGLDAMERKKNLALWVTLGTIAGLILLAVVLSQLAG